MRLKHKLLLISVVFLAILLSAVSAWADDATYGQCSTLLKAVTDAGDRLGDTELGCIGADAIREAASTDIALLPAGMLGANMEAGAITDEILAACYPQDEEIYTVRIHLSELKDILEACTAGLMFDPQTESVSAQDSDTGLFPQISGFLVSFDTTGPAGDRVWTITLDGHARTRDFSEDVYCTIAYPVSLANDPAFPALADGKSASVTVRETVIRYIRAHGGLLPAEDFQSRVTLLGTGQNALGSDISPLFWVIFAVVVLIFSGSRYRKMTRTR